MPGGLSPTEPVKASHRFISQLIHTSFKGEVSKRPEEFDAISRVFQRVGGSWARLYRGSVGDVELLRKVLKVAIREERLTPKAKWA